MQDVRMKTTDIARVRALLLSEVKNCPLCLVPFSKIQPRNICLDHCHSSGYVRNVLCRNCNGNLGRLCNLATRSKKNLTQLGWLRNALEFLEYHSVPRTKYIHPAHKTEEEKRLLRNKRARAARAKNKTGAS